MFSYLRQRKGHYYLRLRVPADLRSITPEPEVIKSLRTNCPCSCGLHAPRYPQGLHPCPHSVYLSGTGRRTSYALLERKQKGLRVHKPTHPVKTSPEASSPLLAAMVIEYINDKKSGWTGKTLFEYQGYFKLPQDVLGVQTVAAITREEVRKLRDALCLLPAHLGQKFDEDQNPYPFNKILTIYSFKDMHCKYPFKRIMSLYTLKGIERGEI